MERVRGLAGRAAESDESIGSGGAIGKRRRRQVIVVGMAHLIEFQFGIQYNCVNSGNIGRGVIKPCLLDAARKGLRLMPEM